MSLLCRSTVIGTLPVLHLSGDLDLGSLPAMHGAVTQIVTAHPGKLIAIDLDGVAVLDDAGLGVLLGAAGRAREASGDLVLVCSSQRFRARFERSGLARAIEVRDRLTP